MKKADLKFEYEHLATYVDYLLELNSWQAAEIKKLRAEETE